MRRRTKTIGISQIQKQAGLPFTKRGIVETVVGHLPKEQRTQKMMAKSYLATQINDLRRLKQALERRRAQGKLSKKHSRFFPQVKAVCRLLNSKEIREIYLRAESAKLKTGLTSVTAAWGFKPVVEAVEILREGRGFRTYDQTVDNILKDERTRVEFSSILGKVTSPGPGKERPEQTKVAYAIALTRKNPLIIDVGPSYGVPTEKMAKFLKKKDVKAKTVSADVLPRKEAIERLGKLGIKVLEIDITQSSVIPRGQPKADLVIANRVLRYLLVKQQRMAIRNMLKDLKVGGYLFIPYRLYRKVSAEKVEPIPLEELFKRVHL